MTARYADRLGLELLHAGKVRELYRLPGGGDGPDRLLMVATDNISAFDFVLSTQIPDKGAILTQLSLWWFEQLGVPHHVISADVPESVAGRAVVCERLEMIPIECVARGYLTGSGWVDYQTTGSVCGVPLPSGLHDGAKLVEPVFTPATKAELGEHDENIGFAEVRDRVGTEDAETIRDLTLRLYATAERIASAHGLVLADTKFEFGKRADGTVVLADEVLTPDSSRFWDATGWADGRLESFDKQFLRNWLLYESGWDRAGGEAPPPLPDEIVSATRERYLEAYRRLTGREFAAAPVG